MRGLGKPRRRQHACMDAMMDTWTGLTGLVFVNLVDFDSVYGHRRDAEDMPALEA